MSTPKPTRIVAHVHAPGAWYYVTWQRVNGADVVYESEHQGEEGHVTRTAEPRTSLLAVAKGTTRYTKIRNVVGGTPSEWVTVTLNDLGEIVVVDEDPQPNPKPPKPDPDPDPDPKPDPDSGPARPANVRAHCITHQSTKIEWDRDPAVHEYEVWIDGHRDAAQHTQDTLVTVNALKPSTAYTAHVVAHTADGKQSAPGSVQFRTGIPEPAPIPDPDVDTAADWPAPDLMVWPLENGKVRASWVDPDDGQKPKGQMGSPYWHVSLDQKTWFFTRERQYEFEVAPGGEVMVSVYGVWDNTLTAIATKGVAL